MPRNHKLSAALGTSVEYYDFIIFAYFAPYLAQIFFTSASNMVLILLTYSIGYLARPVGGILIGHLADSLGAQTAFRLSILLMGLSSMGIGLLPTYANIGILSPISLVLLRLLQGLAQGAELPTGLLVTYQNKQQQPRFGTIIAGCTIGSMLATTCFSLYKHYFTTAQIISGYWRLPFLLGGALALIVYFWRYYQQSNTVVFQPRSNLFDKLEQLYQDKTLVNGVIIAMPSAILVLAYAYLPSYLDLQAHMLGNYYWMLPIGLSICIFAIPAFELYYEQHKYSKQLVTLISSIAYLVLAPVMLAVVLHNNSTSMLFALILYTQLTISSLQACYPHMLFAQLKASLRGLGFSCIHNLAYLGAALLFAVNSYLSTYWGSIALMTIPVSLLMLFRLGYQRRLFSR